MTVEMFLGLLAAFSVITGLITEAVKKIISDKANLSYNLMALIVALVVGCAGTSIYYYLNDISFTGKNVIFILLLSIASGLCSELGFDKVKQAITQLGFKKGE